MNRADQTAAALATFGTGHPLDVALQKLEQIEGGLFGRAPGGKLTEMCPEDLQNSRRIDAVRRVLGELEGIVRALATTEPEVAEDDGYGESGWKHCSLCGGDTSTTNEGHKPECVWDRAVAWCRANPEEQPR